MGKSRKVRNTLEPEWNFSANLILSSSEENSNIIFEVIDDDYGKDDFIGSFTYSLKQAIKDTDKEATWHNLDGCKTGKISFSTIYLPDEDQTKEETDESMNEIEQAKENTQIEDSSTKITETPEIKQEAKDSSEKKDEKVNEPDEKQSVGVESDVKFEEDTLKSKTDEKNLLSPKEDDTKSSKVEEKDACVTNSKSNDNSLKINERDDINKSEVKKEADNSSTQKGEKNDKDEDTKVHEDTDDPKRDESKDSSLLKKDNVEPEKEDIEISTVTVVKVEKTIEIEQTISESQSDLLTLKTDDKSVESSQEFKVEPQLEVDEKSSGEKNTQNEEQTTTDSKYKERKESKSQDEEISPKEDSKFVPGVLEVTIKKASELVNNDRIGKSDPYVKIRHGDTEFRSKTIQNTLEPEWNYSCKFDILNFEEPYIHINVYDDDFGKDNIEGCYSLSLKEAMSDLPEEGSWYNLVGCK